MLQVELKRHFPFLLLAVEFVCLFPFQYLRILPKHNSPHSFHSFVLMQDCKTSFAFQEQEIAAEARIPTSSESELVENIAENMRHKAVNEVEQTEREVERGRFVARVSQIVDYIFFLIYGLLAIRLLLALFAAREGNGFVQFVRSVTDPVYAPFKGIVASPTTAEGTKGIYPQRSRFRQAKTGSVF